jgi:hypothetical protein
MWADFPVNDSSLGTEILRQLNPLLRVEHTMKLVQDFLALVAQGEALQLPDDVSGQGQAPIVEHGRARRPEAIEIVAIDVVQWLQRGQVVDHVGGRLRPRRGLNLILQQRFAKQAQGPGERDHYYLW